MTVTSSPNNRQRWIAHEFKIPLDRASERMAAALLQDLVGGAIGIPDASPPTELQIDLARDLGISIEGTRRVVGARIADCLEDLRLRAVEDLGLEWAEIVEVTGGPWRGQRLAVSSVDRRGRVWFKGGNGRSAWATQVVRSTS